MASFLVENIDVFILGKFLKKNIDDSHPSPPSTDSTHAIWFFKKITAHWIEQLLAQRVREVQIKWKLT